MTELLRKWLRWYDPVHRGWTREGIAGGACAMEGRAFPRVRGGYHLYRRAMGDAADVLEIVGAAGFDAEAIETFPWVTHAPSGAYEYEVRAVSGGGIEANRDVVRTRMRFDADGAFVGPSPNSPCDLRVRRLAGGAFEIWWRYVSGGQQCEPAAFRIHHDGGTGVVEYESPVGSVAFRSHRRDYVYRSAPFAIDAPTQWAVRAVSADGVGDGNETTAAPPPLSSPGGLAPVVFNDTAASSRY